MEVSFFGGAMKAASLQLVWSIKKSWFRIAEPCSDELV
jgi:hypothetical protein